MIRAASLLLWTVLAGPPPGTSAPPEADVGDPESLDVELSLRVPSGRFDELSEALGMRLPDARVVDHRVRAAEQAPDVFAEIVAANPGGTQARLTLVLRDGRAFVREIQVPPEQWARVMATELSNLLYAIELEEVQADLTDVAIPAGDAPVQTIRLEPHAAPPMPASELEPEAELGPELGPEPGPEPLPPTPGWWIWPELEGGVGLALPPPSYAQTFGGGGGGLGVMAQHRGGALVGLASRVHYAPGEVSVVRIRVAARGGWVLDRAHLRVAVAGQLFAEPFVVRYDRSPVDPVEANGANLRRVLLGGGADAWVAWRRAAEGRPLVFAVGPALALDVSFAPGAGVVGLAEVEEDLDSVESRRLGGLELSAGLRVGIGFGVNPSRPLRRARLARDPATVIRSGLAARPIQ